MAKKSLKKRIDELIDALGGADKPTLPQIRSRLFKFAALAEELEQGKAIRKAEAKTASLTTEVEKLQVQLQEARSEIKMFRTDQKERENESAELPEIQFKILRGLPTENIGDGATLKGISQRARIPPDEAAVHLDRLEKAGFAKRRLHDGHTRIVAWHRTIAGDELVLAKRLAGGEEEAAEEQTTKYVQLAQAEQLVLVMMAKAGAADIAVDEITHRLNAAMPTIGKAYANRAMVALLLIQLRDKGLAVQGNGPRWTLTPEGMVYLAERELL
jgi:DNA-binding MarR family transcriptional regulator